MNEMQNVERETKIVERRQKIRGLAKRAAVQEGHDWNTLPREKRQAFLRHAGALVKKREIAVAKTIVSFQRGERNGWPAFAPLSDQTLIDAKHGIGVIWSAKCACTKVVLWYFKLIGLLDAAMFFHPFAHKYRINVLYSSRQYLEWMRTSDWRRFSWYQFCRDPVSRALSSYRHNLAYGYADKTISRLLGKEVSALQGYSLVEFLHYVEKLNLDKCDHHLRLQRNQISDFVDVKIINIDESDMFEQMNVIERQIGLPVTDFASHEAFRKDDLRRAKIAIKRNYSASDVLSKADAKGMWPVDSSVLDSGTLEWIKRLYARDMQFIYGNNADMPEPREPETIQKIVDLTLPHSKSGASYSLQRSVLTGHTLAISATHRPNTLPFYALVQRRHLSRGMLVHGRYRNETLQTGRKSDGLGLAARPSVRGTHQRRNRCTTI